MPTISTKRGELYYQSHHPENASQTIIWLHGAGGTHMTFPAELRRLPGAHVITPDLSGHGRSQGEAHQRIAHYAEDLREFIEALELDHVILGGHSMGGAIAQWFTLAYPERVRGVILMGTSAYITVNPDLLRGLQTESTETLKKLNQWNWHPSADEALRAESLKALMNVPLTTIYNDFIASDAFNVKSRLNAIRQPVLVIAGDTDKMIPLDQSKTIAETVQSGTLKTVQDAGHMFMLEQPETVAEIVIDWISSL